MDIKLLEQPLDPKFVKGRKQAGRNVSYIEGWHAIAEANRIFGFDKWSRETIYCKEICRMEVKVGKQQKDGFKVGYEAMVHIKVYDEDGVLTVREGTGHGSGIATDLFDCIEGAAKEAETDAMKRALMTFGNPFGLALYDKTQANVGVPATTINADQIKELDALLDLSGFDRQDFLNVADVSELEQIDSSRFDNAKGFLRKKLPKAE